MTKAITYSLLAAAAILTAVSLAAEPKQPPTEATAPWEWPSEPPPGCPFEPSKDFRGLSFTRRRAVYTEADTWYPSWAADDRLYSPFTDGKVEGVFSGSGYNFQELARPVTGFAVIEGSDPLRLKVTRAGVIPHEPFPYGGQYPCGSLVHGGVWYYGTYNLDWHKKPWDVMGPFVGFNISKDFGKTWLPETRTARNPLFGESAKDGRPVVMWKKAKEYDQWPGKAGKPGAKVKIGSPHFVDFGKNMQHSPDGKAYLVAHGATRPSALNSWISGDQIYLLRVKPSIETINDPKAYEFFTGRDDQGRPLWSGDFSKIKPLLEWNGAMGCVTATYNAPLNRYFLCVTNGHGPKGDTEGPYDTYLLESEAITGPYRLVVYMKHFGEQAYFVNIPSKFISPDGLTFWLYYSHGWQHPKQNPPGSKYAMNLHEVRLKRGGSESQ
jgi:hypothetical protein